METEKPTLKQGTVKEEIYKDLMATSIQEEPNKYMDLLDNFEQLDLVEKQQKRRENMAHILNGGQDFFKE